jgi:hypothetical protein
MANSAATKKPFISTKNKISGNDKPNGKGSLNDILPIVFLEAGNDGRCTSFWNKDTAIFVYCVDTHEAKPPRHTARSLDWPFMKTVFMCIRHGLTFIRDLLAVYSRLWFRLEPRLT